MGEGQKRRDQKMLADNRMLEEIAQILPVEAAKRPTKARPGSERKMLRMSLRYSHGLPLYVEGDA